MTATSAAGQGISLATAKDTPASTLVLFDFDGTLTTKDTLIEFVHFYRGKTGYWLGMLLLAPVMALYLLRLIPNWKAKQYFLSRYFRGEAISDFDARCREFSRKVIPSLIRPAAKKAIEQYRGQNATMAVVSASAENWVRPWCDQHGLICLATRLEVKDGYLTGKIKGRNCYGDEKKCRVEETFDLSTFTNIIAYGDSSGDKAMLALAHQKFYRPWRDAWE